MSVLIERAKAAAEARAETLRDKVAARIARALPGATRRIDGDRIVLTGRGLLRRWMNDARMGDWRGDGR